MHISLIFSNLALLKIKEIYNFARQPIELFNS